MKLIVILFLLKLVYGSNTLPSFYHTSNQIDKEVKEILDNCQMKVTQKSHGILQTILLQPKSNDVKHKAFIIFGEHARELISVETGLYLLKHICENEIDIKVKMILNMNPGSRQYVERGHYCLRENLNGVDLNRNYGFQWQFNENHFQQDSSGPEPFSEIETQTVKKILESFKPQTFITVHSGTLAILQPWAYQEEVVVLKHQNLRGIKHQCKNCLIGGAATEIGYTASGTSMDYAYAEGKVKQSYTLEIYQFEKQQIRQEPESDFAEFLQFKENAQINNKQLFCFDYFNPRSQQRYNEIIKQWNDIIIKLIKQQ